MTPVLTECLVTFRATLNAADFLLSPLIQASNSVSPFAGALKPLFLCHTRFWKCIKVLHTIGSLLCLVCARFILPLLTGCSHVWKSSVLWLDLKPVSCLCLSEKRRVLNSQDLFALPVLRRCSGGSRGTPFLSVFPLKHSFMWWKRSRAFSKARNDVCNIHFCLQIKTRYTSQFEFRLRESSAACEARSTVSNRRRSIL